MRCFVLHIIKTILFDDYYMKQFNLVNELLSFIDLKKQQNNTIGFVPTMGSLHDGHESLIETCQKENDITIVSVYVNPVQFNSKKDFINYPRNLKLDISCLEKLNCDVLFSPDVEEMEKFPKLEAKINLGNLNMLLEAKKRPGHFKGVIIIVSKLFQIISPNRAYFGEKDLQQLLIIKQLSYQRFNEINIVSCPTIRNPYGLAKSSRHRNLNSQDLKLARVVYEILKDVKRNISEWGVKKSKKYVENYLIRLDKINLDYFEIIESESFSFTQEIHSNCDYYALIAVKIRNIRLIDNLKL